MPVPVRTLTTAAAAMLLALVVPLSAAAAPSPYPVNKPDTWDRTIVPATVITHPVPAGTFDAHASLKIVATGESPAPHLGVFAAQAPTASRGTVTGSQLNGEIMSDDVGGAVVKLDFGPTTRGVYNVTVTEAASDNYSYGVVTVIPADSAASLSNVTTDPALARTGTTIDAGVLWAAAAAVAAGLLLWVGARLRRRSR
jgi:hypothetical protein